jgi:iron(III) transport system permease protein
LIPLVDRRSFSVWLIGTLVLVLALWLVFDQQDRGIAIRTMLLGLGAGLIAIPTGACLAKAIANGGFLGRCTFLVCVAGLLVPVFMYLSAWDAAFGRLGWLTSTGGDVLKPFVPPWLAAIWIHAMAATPQVTLLLVLANRIGTRAFEEQALLDAGPVAVFFQVQLWRYLPVIGLSLFWVVLSCSREIAVTDLYQIGTLAEQMYLGYSLGQLNSIQGNWTAEDLLAAEGLGVGISVVVIAWATLTAAIFFWNVSGFDQPVRTDRALSPNTNFWWALLSVVTLIVFAGVPIFNLIYRGGFFVESIEGTPVPTWSMEQLVRSVTRALTQYGKEFSWSTVIAGVAATLLLIFSLPVAWMFRRTRGKKASVIRLVGKCAVAMLVAVLAALPGPLIGTFVSDLFSVSSSSVVVYLYDRTITAPVLANVLFCFPVAFLIGLFVVRSISVSSLESSSVEGASTVSQFFRFVAIDQKWSMAGAWLLMFAFCFGELSASQLVLPPGMDSVPRLMLGLLHAGVDEATAGLTIVIIFGISLTTIVGTMLLRLSLRRAK